MGRRSRWVVGIDLLKTGLARISVEFREKKELVSGPSPCAHVCRLQLWSLAFNFGAKSICCRNATLARLCPLRARQSAVRVQRCLNQGSCVLPPHRYSRGLSHEKNSRCCCRCPAVFLHRAFAQNVAAGLIDAYAGSLYSGDKRTGVVNSGGMTTSWWGHERHRGSGKGPRVEFKINGFFRGDNGAFGAQRQREHLQLRRLDRPDRQLLGMVHFGAIWHRTSCPPSSSMPSVIRSFSPTGGIANVPLFNGTGWAAVNAGRHRLSNQVRYTTPNFGGFNGKPALPVRRSRRQ